jgi:hypothetical protein
MGSKYCRLPALITRMINTSSRGHVLFQQLLANYFAPFNVLEVSLVVILDLVIYGNTVMPCPYPSTSQGAISPSLLEPC